ncbi:hypothetical protein JTE90_024701 [Oedothorax gibbosus]|uniref:THAP-type domain-containing protein n=1 Tax=Oedothorax gibbosus TaxID=931172 RepID=A0AAV6U9D8_9ARAC|nr:hypothetical protein JTE90_024701 [Oedothorax gibbosus]
MVNTCVVPGCRGNYDKNEKVTLFRFPKDKFQLQKWVSTIPRENFTPSKHSRVCLRHFKEEEIRRHTEAFENGQKLSVALQQPRLKDGAVPVIFPGSPKYLSKEKVHRPCPDAKKEIMENNQLALAIQESLKEKELYEEKYTFKNWDELILCLNNLSIPSYWN